MDAVDLGGGERLYTAMSEERILAACPDVHGLHCGVGGGRRSEGRGRIVTDVQLVLHAAADPEPHPDRTAEVRGALTGTAAATPRSVLAISEADLTTGRRARCGSS
ncbi:hypothetical protein ACIQGZ_12220 [Streptomyces sp. NPDC092296]|uniref:hypothetical protein n=1 Tax=Streptomyces sp. NPDC092296 TaxID=3366012 RepID=UPI00380DBCA1